LNTVEMWHFPTDSGIIASIAREACARTVDHGSPMCSCMHALYVDSCSIRLKSASLQVVVRRTNRMSTGRNREPLKKFAETIESIDLEKRVAATKWLELL